MDCPRGFRVRYDISNISVGAALPVRGDRALAEQVVDVLVPEPDRFGYQLLPPVRRVDDVLPECFVILLDQDLFHGDAELEAGIGLFSLRVEL